MKEKLAQFIKEQKLSPFNKSKTLVNIKENSIYMTKDAKAIHNKLLSNINSYFCFSDTANLLKCFPFAQNIEEIKNRQNFFRTIQKNLSNQFLENISLPRDSWKPRYDAIVVTEDEKTLTQLKDIGCSVKFITSENDLASLESYDLVYVIDCEELSRALEILPQSVFVNNLEDVYLEKHLIQLSKWQENIKILNQNNICLETIKDILPLFELILQSKSKPITNEEIYEELERINNNIFSQIKNLTVSGESLLSVLSKGVPPELKQIIDKEITKTNIPHHLLDIKIPVGIDEKELEIYIKHQNTREFTDQAALLKKNSNILKSIPEKLQNLSSQILIFDFISGISHFISELNNYPVYSENFKFSNSKNLFLENPQAISFNLANEIKCSILTGANSGGKTTLLEHIIQLITLFQLGLPVSGDVAMPLFLQIYYFAKNNGSMSKGAFETLLTQMSKINPQGKTLILADEIESVTEPGVAGNIISATAEYFISKNCFLVIATHLGFEIQKTLPRGARIDGIEAKGLDDNLELIVDHNPVIGRLAHSTPELIVEKMANTLKTDYFTFIYGKLKG